SGLAMKKLDARPADAALARKVAFPMKPFCRVASVQPAALRQANAKGFGLRAARNDRMLAFVQFGPTYLDESPDEPLFTPLKYARKIGSGAVPGAPVCANELGSRFSMKVVGTLVSASVRPVLFPKGVEKSVRPGRL